jgi:hypothetical protein
VKISEIRVRHLHPSAIKIMARGAATKAANYPKINQIVQFAHIAFFKITRNLANKEKMTWHL